VGDIGGFRLLTSLTGRGAGDSAGETFDMLIEPFEDIWAGWQDQLVVHKLKYMRAKSRTGVKVELVMVRGRKYDPSESVRLGVGGMKSVDNIPTYLSW
jgi:hypothetical protein